MNKKGNVTGIALGLLIVLVLIVGVAAYFVVSGTVQQTSLANQEKEDVASGKTAVSSLKGKPLEITVFASDKANDDKTTKAAAALYVITDYTQEDEKVSGSFAADGTALSTTARTSVTQGLTVNGRVAIIAANNSYYSEWYTDANDGEFGLNPTKQAHNVDLSVWQAGGDLNITMQDEDEVEMPTTANLTIGSGGVSETLAKLEFRQRTDDFAYNLKGFYVNLDNSDSNITSVTVTSDSVSGSVATLSKTSLNLERTTNDDIVFEFSEPILLLQNDFVKVDTLTIEGDSDGCSGNEELTLTAFDTNWYRSSIDDSMKFGPENDAASPADVGAGDVSQTISCAAS